MVALANSLGRTSPKLQVTTPLVCLQLPCELVEVVRDADGVGDVGTCAHWIGSVAREQAEAARRGDPSPPGTPAVAAGHRRSRIFLNRPQIRLIDRIHHRGAPI